MFHNGNNCNENKNEHRHREGYRNMTGEGKTIRYHTDQITKKHKHKDRKNKWEIGSSLFAYIITNHSGYELVC